jgi:hypothetical protein
MSLATVATAKVIKKPALKAARADLAVGEHNVDYFLRVCGRVTVGEDYQTKPTVAIPYKLAFAALCHVSGCTGKAGIEKIRRAMEIALADDTDVTAKEALARAVPLAEQVEREVIDPMLASHDKIPGDGKVTTNLATEFFTDPEQVAAITRMLL